MEILDDVEIVDLMLHVKNIDALVIGDAHLGYEEALTKKGILLPKFQFKEIMYRVEKALKATKPKRIIIVGDLKHEFGTISREEWNQITTFIDMLKKHGEIILIKGNHDVLLQPIVKKCDLELLDHYAIDDYYFCHGHKVPEDLSFSKAKIVFMGHEHPAIGLRDGPRREIFKCFLKGKFKRKTLIVLPSLSSLPEGTDVKKERLQSPLIQNIGNFEVYVIEDKTYKFGKVKNL